MNIIGISSYITGMTGLQDVIARCKKLDMNTIGISSRETWLDQKGSSNREFHKEYVDYTLKNTDLNIVLRPNHTYYMTNGHFDVDGGSRWIQNHWEQIINWTIKIAQMYPDNNRILAEVINEYSLTDIWTRSQDALNKIRKVSDISLIFNKWAQPWTKLNDPLDKDYYSYHYYFNDPYWSPSKAEEDMQIALKLGLKIINTEIGANTKGGQSITAAQIAEVNQVLEWCNPKGIGNLLWNTTDDVDFAIMETLGLKLPVTAQPSNYTIECITAISQYAIDWIRTHPHPQVL